MIACICGGLEIAGVALVLSALGIRATKKKKEKNSEQKRQ